MRTSMPDDRIHLAQDRAFFYLNRVYSAYGRENLKLSLAFQREVINNIVPRVRPDLIHCNDWMTGRGDCFVLGVRSIFWSAAFFRPISSIPSARPFWRKSSPDAMILWTITFAVS